MVGCPPGPDWPPEPHAVSSAAETTMVSRADLTRVDVRMAGPFDVGKPDGDGDVTFLTS
ncbi:hypothetical protein GCM10017788_24740 [Amycolatopsis acidiphila]|nr:hypothetical protein GCM10017788_24740 [Amycolatopsis acidiphila]